MTVRTRFSPSPTGMIHIGNARTALFAALYAQKHAGQFVLRIEDTDQTRSTQNFINLLQQDLHWLNIFWQEGPDIGGEFAPYLQSQRQTIYAEYYNKLADSDLMYPCFCTDQELLLARKLQLTRGQAPRYMGTCLKLSKEEIANKIAQGVAHAWRFKVPTDTIIKFNDVVRGEQSFKSDDIGDFIIRRADGTAPFLFCNAIDDATMHISHVIRGEDHLANTPRQIMLLKQLKLPIPHYGHLPLILGEDGAPLSKRHGSCSVKEMQEQGYLPLALLNYLTRLGHSCEINNLLPFAQLTEHFQLEKISKSPARFDLIQLMYWQKIAVQALDQKGFWQWLGDDIKAQIPLTQQELFAQTIQANIAFPKEAAHWATILFTETLTFNQDQLTLLQETGPAFFATAAKAVAEQGLDFPAILASLKTTLQINGKKLYMPIRIALTGQDHGPELIPIVQLLGKDKLQMRFHAAEQLASK